MAMMNVCGPVFCPNCPPIYNRKQKQIGEHLECSESNYSGCGVDMANCPTCGKGYQISFKIDEITPCQEWDVIIDKEAEKQAEIESKRDLVTDLEKKLEEAKKQLEKVKK